MFNNDLPDPDFGITSPITITQLTPAGASTGVVFNVPQTYLDTIFSSKSELGINLTDEGCDPNQLVKITDTVAFTTASQASAESFSLLQTAAYDQVLRSISFTPYVPPASDTPTLPQWGLILMAALLVALAGIYLPKPRLGTTGQ